MPKDTKSTKEKKDSLSSPVSAVIKKRKTGLQLDQDNLETSPNSSQTSSQVNDEDVRIDEEEGDHYKNGKFNLIIIPHNHASFDKIKDRLFQLKFFNEWDENNSSQNKKGNTFLSFKTLEAYQEAKNYFDSPNDIGKVDEETRDNSSVTNIYYKVLFATLDTSVWSESDITTAIGTVLDSSLIGSIRILEEKKHIHVIFYDPKPWIQILKTEFPFKHPKFVSTSLTPKLVSLTPLPGYSWTNNQEYTRLEIFGVPRNFSWKQLIKKLNTSFMVKIVAGGPRFTRAGHFYLKKGYIWSSNEISTKRLLGLNPDRKNPSFRLAKDSTSVLYCEREKEWSH